jgi:RNA-dependent RNA polymerase
VDDFSYVELTPSQRKIVYPSGVLPDPAHRVIDILRSSHVRTPCCLSVETIINLSENGVPKKVFLDLLHQGLEELVEPLLEWDGPDAMRNLWCKVCRIGGVMSARRAREKPGLARVKGYVYSEHGREEDNSEDEDEIFDTTEEEKSSAWWRDEISGCPSSLEETVMSLLDSGFTPENCPILRKKLWRVTKGHVENFIKAYRIMVPMSASAFLIPGKISGLVASSVFNFTDRFYPRYTWHSGIWRNFLQTLKKWIPDVRWPRNRCFVGKCSYNALPLQASN